MNKPLRFLSLQASKHLRCFRLCLLTLLLCGFMQTTAQTWTDSNGFTWSFTVNGTEATDIKFRGGSDLKKIYLYGDPDRPEEVPFVPGAWDAAAMRFSYTDGAHLPTISDDVYFGLKTLIFDVSDVTDNFDMKVMNGWWSNTYYDHVKWENGLNELQITSEMANECAQGGLGRDLNLLLYNGSMTFKAVYYETSEVSGEVVIPAKVYAGATELTVTSIGDGAFSGFADLTNVTIPEGVTSIGNSAFAGCTGLTGVTIPEGVTSIGNSAFRSCSSLTSVTLPSSVTSIGEYAFYFCGGLTSMTIPKGVTKIEDYMLCACYNLTSVTIPEGVTSIGKTAFSGCHGLTSVTLPSSLTSIGEAAFGGCSGLTSVTIPSSVTSIGDRAFSSCTGLTSISVDKGNVVYDSRNNCNAIIETETNTLISGCKNTIIPEDVTSIGNDAFSSCSGLTSVTLPSSVTSIGDWAFAWCGDLTSVTIPSSVTSIGEYAFYCCSELAKVTSLIKEPFTIIDRVFMCYDESWNLVFTSATLYVPAGTKSLYEATPAWNQFQNIVELDDETSVNAALNDRGDTTNERWYTIDGRMLQGKPTQKGVYIHNGSKAVKK